VYGKTLLSLPNVITVAVQTADDYVSSTRADNRRKVGSYEPDTHQRPVL
jgi:hypothetical protein